MGLPYLSTRKTVFIKVNLIGSRDLDPFSENPLEAVLEITAGKSSQLPQPKPRRDTGAHIVRFITQQDVWHGPGRTVITHPVTRVSPRIILVSLQTVKLSPPES